VMALSGRCTAFRLGGAAIPRVWAVQAVAPPRQNSFVFYFQHPSVHSDPKGLVSGFVHRAEVAPA